VEEEPWRVGRWEGRSQSQARINQEAKGRGQGRTLLAGASPHERYLLAVAAGEMYLGWNAGDKAPCLPTRAVPVMERSGEISQMRLW
jgi:hypothetical protein